MTMISVAVDGEVVAAADTDGLALLSVHLFGSVTEPHAAMLSFDGTVAAGGAGGYRTWLEALQLRAGQAVTVRFGADGIAATPVRTQAGLHPGQPPDIRTDVKPTPQQTAAMRSHPRVRAGFSFVITTSTGTECEVRGGPEDENFQCLVLWTLDSLPDVARIRASVSNRERIVRREHGTPAFEGRLALGDSVTIRCGD